MPQIRTVADCFIKQLLIRCLERCFFVENFFPKTFPNLWENFLKTSGKLSKAFPKKFSNFPNATNQNASRRGSKCWRLAYKSGGGRVEANADEVPEPTAIEGLDGGKAFVCYPNPATDFVSLKGLEPQAEVKVYSMVGTCVLRVKADTSGLLDLDVRHLSEGLYLVKAGSKTMKLEVKH